MTRFAAPRILPAGDAALVVEFGDTADRRFHDAVVALDAQISADPPVGVLELVPSYRSLLVHFDPRTTSGDALREALLALACRPAAQQAEPRNHWRLPACYEPPHGEDLDEVAHLLGSTPHAVAAAHAQASYEVVMYGFAPGFVFLSGLPAELAISRRATPRPPAPPGALTVAAGQALIASVAMPTGWYMVGRTPARTFAVDRDPPFPIAVGDSVSFTPVDGTTFERLCAAEDAGADCLLAASEPC